jgi:hypothetical protein
MKDIIERVTGLKNVNSDYIDRIKKEYMKFQDAWNTFSGLIIKDDNVEATIPVITEQSKFIYCCLSSSSTDHEGHVFYLLLKYLAL